MPKYFIDWIWSIRISFICISTSSRTWDGPPITMMALMLSLFVIYTRSLSNQGLLAFCKIILRHLTQRNEIWYHLRIYYSSGARPTKHISIEFEIRWKFKTLGVKYTRPITTIFCTRHDSVTVVTCAKYRCDRSSIFETRAFWIFIEFRIRSKCA